MVQGNAKPFKFPRPPTFDSVDAEREYKLERLALAFRVFAKLGLDEGVAGHLTLRDPEHSDCFWVNPFGVPFAHMTKSDLLCVNHEGDVIKGGRPDGQIYNRAAFAIHARIHHARPDVHAACHSHSIYGKAWSTLGRNIDIISQDACSFYKDVALYPNFGGVVLDEQEGDSIAEHLGSKKSLILQNHGILTAGKTIEEATAWFIQLEKACQVQILAESTGSKPTIVGDEEAEFTYKTVGNPIAGWFWAQPYFTMAERECNGAHKQ